MLSVESTAVDPQGRSARRTNGDHRSKQRTKASRHSQSVSGNNVSTRCYTPPLRAPIQHPTPTSAVVCAGLLWGSRRQWICDFADGQPRHAERRSLELLPQDGRSRLRVKQCFVCMAFMLALAKSQNNTILSASEPGAQAEPHCGSKMVRYRSCVQCRADVRTASIRTSGRLPPAPLSIGRPAEHARAHPKHDPHGQAIFEYELFDNAATRCDADSLRGMPTKCLALEPTTTVDGLASIAPARVKNNRCAHVPWHAQCMAQNAARVGVSDPPPPRPHGDSPNGGPHPPI